MFPLRPLPHIQCYKAAMWVAWMWQIPKYLRLRPLLGNRHTQAKYMAQMKEQIKAPKIELSNEEIANLSDAQFKTMVIRMLTEMVEYGCKIEEKVQAMKNEIKENVQGTNSEGKETRTQINHLEQKEEINNQNRMKKLEFKKMRRGLRTSRTILNVPISES